jgi:cytochrome b subunit of formate dehydrogenase
MRIWRARALLGLLLLGAPAGAWGQDEASAPPSLTQTQEIQICQQCHANPDLRGFDVQGRSQNVTVDAEAFLGSVHGKLRCSQCHTDIDPLQLPHPQHARRVQCRSCHLEKRLPEAPEFDRTIFKEYADSIHGKLAARGDADAPACADCHGHHDIRPPSDPKSRVRRENIPQMCSGCHADQGMVGRRRISHGDTLRYYLHSVHGRLLEEGGSGHKSAAGKPPAVCTDCHGVHGIRPANDPNSQVARPNLPSTCGKCHGGILAEWKQSIHGQAWAHGVTEAPVCTNCHGEHTIRSPENPQSSVYPTHIVATCSHCHENAALQRQLGLPTLRLSTYRQSYHGILNRYGSTEVAECASCHGAHNILPSTDPRSPIYPGNLQQTCGSCHPGIGKGVSMGKIHMAGTRAANPLYYWIKVIYQWLIFGLIGFFVIYTLLDLRNHWRGRVSHAVSPHSEDDPLSHEYLERFNPSEKWQHILLVVSFTLLVISGMPMSYPEAGWAERLLTFPATAAARGIIHRIAAVILMLVAVWHLFYLATPRGRMQLRALMFGRKDLADILQMIRCYLGLSNEKPRFGHFSWIEKTEYLAVVWGTFVMVLTGLLLWFEAQALHILPLWAWNVAKLVHSYEALLAFLAIIVWHLYHVHFKPGVFPMSDVWLTGKISLRHLQEEHPLEWEEMQSRQSGEEEPDER